VRGFFFCPRGRKTKEEDDDDDSKDREEMSLINFPRYLHKPHATVKRVGIISLFNN